MVTNKGFTIEISSHYDGWWRYNTTLMCGCFDAEDTRIDFVATESHVAEVGSNLKERPTEVVANRTLQLKTVPCDHLLLYIYIVPHTLPADREIDDARPFEIELRIAYDGKLLRTEKRPINQWSGTSVEMRVERK